MSANTMRLRLTKAQLDVYRALRPGVTVAMPFGRGAGKSWLQRQLWYLLVSQFDGMVRGPNGQRGVRIVVLMDTLKHFTAVHGMLMRQELSGKWGFLGAVVNKTTGMATFPGGSWIRPFPATEHNSTSGRGTRADVVAIDEADDVDLDVYDSVCVPWFSEPWSLRQRIVSGTPRRGRYGLLYRTHQRGLDATWPDHYTRHSTYAECPEIVGAEIVEEARRGPAETFRREWLCDFDAAEGLVLDEFREDFHVREPPPDARWQRVLVGVDFGYTDPGVFEIAGVAGHGNDAQAHMLDEVYETGKVLDWWIEQAQRVKQQFPQAEWFADPSRPDSIEALRTGAGINIRGAKGRIDEGLTTLANLIHVRRPDDSALDSKAWARMYVSPRCRNLIREIMGYRRKRDPHDRERFIEAIAPGNDHAVDGARYLAFGAFGKPPRIRTEWGPDSVI